MNPLVTSALISAGSNVLGGLGGGKEPWSVRTARRSAIVRGYNDYADQMRATLGGGSIGNTVYRPGGQTYLQKNEGHELWQKGSDMIGRERDLDFSGRHLQQAFDVGAENGLTPQEVAGSPAAGGTGRSGGNQVLGQSGAAAHQVKAQTVNAADDRAAMLKAETIRSKTALGVAAIQAGAKGFGDVLGANTAKRGQDVAANSQQLVAQIAAKAGIQNARTIAAAQVSVAKIAQSTALTQLAQKKVVDTANIQQIAAQTALALQDGRFKADLHNERWERLFSTMSSENVMASTIAVLNGVDVKDVLQGVEADEATKEQLRQYITHVTAKEAHIAKEIVGGGQVLRSIGQGIFGGD